VGAGHRFCGGRLSSSAVQVNEENSRSRQEEGAAPAQVEPPGVDRGGGRLDDGIEGLDSACICMYYSLMKLVSLPCYCATLRQAARAVTVLYEDMLADSGLHATQYTALQLLDSVPGLTTTELAEALGIDQTTATRTLALINRAGLAKDTVGIDRR